MSLSEINEIRVNDILVYEGKGELGFKMMITLGNGELLYFNSLWIHRFKANLLDNRNHFEKIEIEADYIDSIYCFEGVGFYILISNGYIIHLYQEVLDFEKPDYRYTYKIVSKSQGSLYDKLLNDIIEMGESDSIIEAPPKFW